MTKSEAQINDIHGDMKVLKELANRYDNSLYDPEFGVCSRIQRVEQRQVGFIEAQKALPSNRANVIALGSLVVAVGSIIVALVT